jgi:acyl-CoA thioesterase FadM
MLIRVHATRLQTRWTDFDTLGHITHAAYPVYLDEARAARSSDDRERELLVG